MKIHAWFYLISAIQVTKVMCKEQSHAVDDQPLDVVGKLHLKKFERDRHEALHLSVSQNKKAHNTESKDQLFITSHQHKGAQKVNDDVDVLVSYSWPSLSQFHDTDEVGVSSICPEINPCEGIAQKDLVYVSALSLCSDYVACMYGGPQGQYKNISHSTKIYLTVQKYISQYIHVFLICIQKKDKT